jgi:hypothetical protein
MTAAAASGQGHRGEFHIRPRFSDGYVCSKWGKQWEHEFERKLAWPSATRTGVDKLGGFTPGSGNAAAQLREKVLSYLHGLAHCLPELPSELDSDEHTDDTEAATHAEYMSSFRHIFKIHSSPFATVYAAIDLALRKPVILKACSAELSFASYCHTHIIRTLAEHAVWCCKNYSLHLPLVSVVCDKADNRFADL